MRPAAWILCCTALLFLFLPPAPAEPDAAPVMTAAEQAVYADILLAAAEGRDTVACDGIVSHTKILTQLGIYYGRLSDLSGLYTWENGVLRLNLAEFSVLEQHRLELEARVTELMEHLPDDCAEKKPSPWGESLFSSRNLNAFPCGEGVTRSVTDEADQLSPIIRTTTLRFPPHQSAAQTASPLGEALGVLRQKRLLRQIARVIAEHREYIPGEFVCGDYAVLFHKMAQRVGIRTELCFGRVNGTLHAWNQVSLGGRARYYDITWYDGDLPAPRYLCSPRPWGRTAQTGDKWLPEP